MWKQTQQSLLDHPAAPGEADYMVVEEEARAPQSPAQQLQPWLVERHRAALAGTGAAQRPDGFRGEPHGLHAVIAPDLDDQPGDGRVNLHVLVGIYVVQRQT